MAAAEVLERPEVEDEEMEAPVDTRRSWVARFREIATPSGNGLDYQKARKLVEIAQTLAVAYQERLQDQDEDLMVDPLDPDAVNGIADWGLMLQEKWERVVGLAVIVGTIAWASLAGHWGAVEQHEQQQANLGIGMGTNHPTVESLQQAMAIRQSCVEKGMIDQRIGEGIFCVSPRDAMGLGE